MADEWRLLDMTKSQGKLQLLHEKVIGTCGQDSWSMWDYLTRNNAIAEVTIHHCITCHAYTFKQFCQRIVAYARDHGQYWFRLWPLGVWRHQAITGTNADVSSIISQGIQWCSVYMPSALMMQNCVRKYFWKSHLCHRSMNYRRPRSKPE